MDVIEVSNLKKQYRYFLLDNVSFSVNKGDIAGFIGVNGSGKTTTIKSMLNLVKPDQGELKLFGYSYNDNEGEIKNRIGVVLDSDYFFRDLSMRDMTKTVSMAYSCWDWSLYQQYMEKFKLEEKQKIGSLSTGMKVKYSLALALSHGAELLIMDEPTSGLDPLMRAEINEILLEFVKDGEHTVFFSTHIVSDLDKIANRVIFLNDGKVVFNKTITDIWSEYPHKNEKEATIENVMIDYLKEKGFKNGVV